jgi:hypothetical protein
VSVHGIGTFLEFYAKAYSRRAVALFLF